MAFKRTIEDFVCGHCGASVVGNGYTNHCPICLWSKHVDVDPGDRAEVCGGMMKPVGVEGSSPSYRIVHACTVCEALRHVNASPSDNAEALASLAGSPGHGIMNP